MKSQLGQGDPCFRDARTLRKIANEFSKGILGLRLALRGLHRPFLEEKIALHAPLSRIVTDLAIVGCKLRGAIEPQPAKRRVEECVAGMGRRAAGQFLDRSEPPFPSRRCDNLPPRSASRPARRNAGAGLSARAASAALIASAHSRRARWSRASSRSASPNDGKRTGAGAQLGEQLDRFFRITRPQPAPRQIPLREGLTRLGRIAQPAFQLIRRGLALHAIELIEAGKDRG